MRYLFLATGSELALCASLLFKKGKTFSPQVPDMDVCGFVSQTPVTNVFGLPLLL